MVYNEKNLVVRLLGYTWERFERNSAT